MLPPDHPRLLYPAARGTADGACRRTDTDLAGHRQRQPRQRLPLPRHRPELARPPCRAAPIWRTPAAPTRIWRQTSPATRIRAAAWSSTPTSATTPRSTTTSPGRSAATATGTGANVNKAASASAAYAAPCTLPSQSFDTFEVNAGVTWKWISYKLSISTGDYFGANRRPATAGNTHGTLYHDVTVTWPLADDLDGVRPRGPHRREGNVARHRLRGDWRLTVAKTFTGGWNRVARGSGCDEQRLLSATRREGCRRRTAIRAS